MWKAGQCVTINHKTCRVVKTKGPGDCIYCEFKNLEACYHPCDKCAEGKLIQTGCHLTRIFMPRDFK